MLKYNPIIHWFTSFFILVFFSFSCSSEENKEQNKQKAFEWVFKDLAKLDPVMVQQVISSEHGKRHYVDCDDDGKPDEVWFIDTDIRHTTERSPLLVRAIDRDKDMSENGEPDLDNDLYIVDWHADGKIDAIIEYIDNDGDQDVDIMHMFFYDENYGLRVWWCRDDGDDNLLWYNVDYAYFQNLCEFKTHFGGDESFACMYISPGDDHWTPFLENPFFFYDEDKDGITEEVLRFVGDNNNIRSIRWSFDADNDATEKSPRDYDISITALSSDYYETDPDHDNKNTSLFFKEEDSETVMIYGFPATIMRRTNARSFVQKQIWAKVLMTWDENDLNSAYRVEGNTYERWEGVIASASTEPNYEMIRVGWPDCGFVNKRYEICMQPKGINEYYYSSSDHRIHLKNSDKIWLKVDYDYDTKVDMVYEWLDKDSDGFVDHITLDLEGDGTIDDKWPLDKSGIKPIMWTFEDVYSSQALVVKENPQYLYYLNKVLISILEKKEKGACTELVWNFIQNKMLCENLDIDQSSILLQSDESLLYYLSLAVDRQIIKLKKLYINESFWDMFYTFRSKGDYKKMMELVQKEFDLHLNLVDYNTWIDQLRSKPREKLVAWNENWVKPNIGWESKKIAFRCYDGHFDIYCKRIDTLIYPNIADGASFHEDTNNWGMDILHINKRGGLGGLVLYINGKAFPLRNEKQPDDPVFSSKLFKETEDQVVVELKVNNIGAKENPYSAQILASAHAGSEDSQIDIRISGGNTADDIKLGIVLPVLPQEMFFINPEIGIMGTWGFQDPAIGWIGLGVIFPANKFVYLDKLSDEYCAVLKYTTGETIRYYATGDWLRSHRFGPTGGGNDWQKKMLLKAASYNQ
ncbi:MAG: DUF4861 family protein [Massilibacteroides sp.]|nr:DUF4861 family protein [Massilibacteroides sp.]